MPRTTRSAPAEQTPSPWPGQQTPIPISEAVMVSWARLVADCKAAGIHRAVRLTDSLIAATAVEHGLPVVSQDGDYAKIASAHSALCVLEV